jgi:indolepyruvate ferredoxin oxidoreductase
MFMLGYAWQKGLLPLSEAALLRAIELNGEAVAMNHSAFAWGRRAAHDLSSVAAVVSSLRERNPTRDVSHSLEEMIERRVAFLTDYQNAAYAARYRARVDAVARLEKERVPGTKELTEAVARGLFKLMSAKDEFEVARLYTDGSFKRQLAEIFEGDLRMELHLSPNVVAFQRKNDIGGSRKITFGPWMFHVLKWLARFKGLRGTILDPFRPDSDRIAERKMLADYQTLLDDILPRLSPANHATAVALARIPEKIRGFGHIRARSTQEARAEIARLYGVYHAIRPDVKMAAE